MKRSLFSDILTAAETVGVYGPEALTDEQIIEAMLDMPSLLRGDNYPCASVTTTPGRLG